MDAPRKGMVRIRCERADSNAAAIEVWSGSEWVPIRWVTGVNIRMRAGRLVIATLSLIVERLDAEVLAMIREEPEFSEHPS